MNNIFYDDNTLNWLLEKDNPSVRYFALTELLKKSPGDREVLEAKDKIFTTGVVPEILKQQHEDGYWIAPHRFYTAKYKGTVWQLMVLAELGANISDNRVKKACEFVLHQSQSRDEFGFSVRKNLKEQGGAKNDVIPCLTGNMVWSLIKLGYFNDQRVQKGIDWICKYQRADDGIPDPPAGWPYQRYEICWGRHSCHMGIVKSLKALSAIPDARRNEMVNEKIKTLAEYLLIHHIFKQSHDLAKKSKPDWLKLGFPLMYQTDILEILEILTDLGYRDERMQEAINVLIKKRTDNGRWILENTFNGKMLVDIETKGHESKWITMKALKVIGMV